MRVLAFILHFVISATWAGVLVTGAIVAGYHRPGVLVGAGIAGLLLAVPASLVARAMFSDSGIPS